MSLTKTLLRATTVVAALAGSAAVAHAAPSLSFEAANVTTNQMFALSGSNNGSSGTQSGSLGSGSSLSTVSISSNGAALSNGGLATITLDASMTAPGTLDIIVTQQGLTAAQAAIPFSVSFTANALTGGSSGSVTFRDFVSAANTNFDTTSSDLLRAVTLSATATATSDVSTATASGLTVGGTYSETQFIEINFASAGSISASSQITPPTAVPEPASMALLGAGLFGVGMIRRRAKRG